MNAKLDPLEKLNDAVRALVARLEAHCPGEAGHGHRVAVFAVAVGERLGMGYDELLCLRVAATLHDLGKLEVEPRLLRRQGALEPEERERVREHAPLSSRAAEGREWLTPSLPVLRHHHERWDGRGCPDGLAGEAIPIGARIVSVAEAFDAMVRGRQGRPPVNETSALAELEAGAGRQFDPAIVEAFRTVQPLIQPVTLD